MDIRFLIDLDTAVFSHRVWRGEVGVQGRVGVVMGVNVGVGVGVDVGA